MTKSRTIALAFLVACGGGSDAGNLPDASTDAPLPDSAPPGSCGATGIGTVEGTIAGETVAPVVRAHQLLVRGEGVAIVLDEVGGPCGQVAATGEHLVLVFCEAPAAGTITVVGEQQFTCPGADASSIVERGSGDDFAEATGGTVTITQVDGGCTTGSFSIDYDVVGGGTAQLTGTFDAVICP